MSTAHTYLYFGIGAYYALVSGVALFVMGHDKLAARKQRQRIPESRLHFISAIGGWPGTWLASMLFRHKTRKQPFKFYQVVATLANFVLLLAFLKMIATYLTST